MARSLSVKIPTAVLIEQVEGEIARIEQDIANYPALRKQYDKDYAEYRDTIAALALSTLKENPASVGNSYDSAIRVTTRGRSVEITVDGRLFGFPEAPECPAEPNSKSYFGRDYISKLELLKKNLKVLKLTTQEEVNASTYNTVIELL